MSSAAPHLPAPRIAPAPAARSGSARAWPGTPAGPAAKALRAPAPPMSGAEADWLPALKSAYPALAGLPDPVCQRALLPYARLMRVPQGTTLFSESLPCPGFPLVLSGEVRVSRNSSQGRQLELYRVGPGELCVVSAGALYGSLPLTAQGETTALTELVLLTPAGFAALNEEAPFRRFVFGVFADRMAELIGLAEAVAFQRLDRRLAQALLGHGPVRHTTHQALAQELGTVREAVTRLLRRFEEQGWVRLGRERIEVLDARALREQAGA